MKKQSGRHTYEASLEQLFEALDAAPIGKEEPFFKKPADKEYYETLLMFAVRKQHAAKYHSDNVKRDLAQALADAKKHAEAVAKNYKKPGETVQFSVSLTSSKYEYVHELVAFLAALRSGLDFLTMAASRSIPGVKAHSIHPLMAMVEKGQGGLVLGVVKKHGAWLKRLKDYRDEVVHRLVVQAPASGWRVSHEGQTSVATLPIVVPASTPKFAFDTRQSRMMDVDLPNGLMQMESFGKVTLEDGTEIVLEHTVTLLTTTGYVLIEDFMDGHLKSYDAFLKDMFGAIAELNFQQLTK